MTGYNQNVLCGVASCSHDAHNVEGPPGLHGGAVKVAFLSGPLVHPACALDGWLCRHGRF